MTQQAQANGGRLSQEERLHYMQAIGAMAQALVPGATPQLIAQRIAGLTDAQLCAIGMKFVGLSQDILRELGFGPR